MGGQTTTGKQVVEPWSGAKPYYTDLYKAANDLFKGPAIAPVTEQQKTALSQIEGMAPKYTTAGQSMEGDAGIVSALGRDTLGGKYMSPDSNPYLKGAVDAAQKDTWENLTRRVLPSIRSDTQLNGTFGGDRTSLMMGQAIGDAMEAALGQANQIYGQNYASERGYQMQSPQILGQGQQQLLAGLGTQMQAPQIIGQAGEQRRSWDQEQLDAPWEQIQRMLGVLTGGGFNAQSSSIPRSASMFQGAAGGGGLGYMAGQQMGIDPMMMALAMSAMGGASGY